MYFYQKGVIENSRKVLSGANTWVLSQFFNFFGWISNDFPLLVHDRRLSFIVSSFLLLVEIVFTCLVGSVSQSVMFLTYLLISSPELYMALLFHPIYHAG